MCILLYRFRPRFWSQTSWGYSRATAIKLFKSYPNLKKKPYWGNHFWARGYFVNTVGLDEDMIRRYVKYQEDEERKAEQDRQDFTLF